MNYEISIQYLKSSEVNLERCQERYQKPYLLLNLQNVKTYVAKIAICYMHFLMLFRHDASFHSVDKPFLILAPLKEKRFWPVFKFFFGSLKSVGVFRKHFILILGVFQFIVAVG